MLNHITIMGRMVRDPELKKTGSGIAVCSFTVAVDRDFSGQNGEKETDFIDCTAWRKSAEFVGKYFTKGKMVVVSGRLQIRKWTDRDGNNRKSAEILADNVYFAESKKDSGSADAAPVRDYTQTNYGSSYAEPYGAGVMPGDDYALLTDDDDQLPY